MVKVHMLIKDGSNTLILAFWLSTFEKYHKNSKMWTSSFFKQINTFF
jgi:hypothetical protein